MLNEERRRKPRRKRSYNEHGNAKTVISENRSTITRSRTRTRIAYEGPGKQPQKRPSYAPRRRGGAPYAPCTDTCTETRFLIFR